MTEPDIPLLRESAAYATRLIKAARAFGESRYQFYRRINWSYRYDEDFHRAESNYFMSGPSDYLARAAINVPMIADVFSFRLKPRQVRTVILKVAAHWLFHAIGRVVDLGRRSETEKTYRKGYVDDIELVYDPEELGVLRAIYPFPLNFSRQWRYFCFLYGRGYRFKITGNPYGLIDVLRFIKRRDVRSLRRMESRAQMRQAHQIVAQGFRCIQLSDEFDVGSLDFARTLARFPVSVVNSAHGVGKYFPVHAYQSFHVVTQRQAEYYIAARPCCYTLRILNDMAPGPNAAGNAPSDEHDRPAIHFVFLSQTFPGISPLIGSSEDRFVTRLFEEFGNSSEISLLFKSHPNSHRRVAPQGFKLLTALDEVNGRPGVTFASFFSTCQIDPTFKGRKLLLRSDHIFPEIAFDESETILDLEALITWLRQHGQPIENTVPDERLIQRLPGNQ